MTEASLCRPGKNSENSNFLAKQVQTNKKGIWKLLTRYMYAYSWYNVLRITKIDVVVDLDLDAER